VDIFTACIFNDLGGIVPDTLPYFFAGPLANVIRISCLFSMRYVLLRFSGFIAKPFIFYGIMERGIRFSIRVSGLQLTLFV
jgi:hypothetical protein